MARPNKKAENDVIKASAAIQISGKITLLQRRAWNVLLAHAYDELPTKDRHTIHVTDLIRRLEFNSDRDEYLKDALRALTSCNVEWDILDKDGEPDWGVAALLAGARITRGICTYTFEPMLREKLHNPRIYARLCLSLQNKFESKYALTLWELCTDYLGSKRDYGETPWIEIDNFRELMGIDIHEYRAFRDVNKRIIVQPLAEINRISDFRVTVEYRHKGRKVTALKFKMRRVVALPEPVTMQAPLFPELDDTPLIVKELRDAGLSMQDALEIWQQGFRCVHEGVRPPIPAEAADVAFEDYIREKLHLLKRKLTSGKVENITGFLLEAIRKNFANPEFVQEQKHQKVAAVQRVRKEQEERLKKLKEQLVEKKEARDKALDDTYGEMAQTFPEVLEAALPSIFADNLFLHQCYDPDKSPLENYQASFMFKEAFRPYLECHAPERIQAVHTQYATEIAALEEHIAALQVV
jgi:Initiator Replication protein